MPEGMSPFYELDRDIVMALEKSNQQVIQKSRDLVSLDTEGPEDTDMEDVVAEHDGAIGDKRKLCVALNSIEYGRSSVPFDALLTGRRRMGRDFGNVRDS
jgi:hypothetical protein